MSALPTAIRLQRDYDVDRLLSDLRACERAHHDWVTHEQVLEGHSSGWNVLPLRARGADMLEACARPHRPEPYEDTILFQHAPYVKELLADLQTKVTSVRISRLQAGGKIYEHSDGPGFELGTAEEIRLHIPIITNDDLWFIIGGQRYVMRAGEIWYGDFTAPHSVENRGTTDRIHLTIDARVTSGLLRLFPDEALAGHDIKCVETFEGETEMKAIPGFGFQLGGDHGALERAVAQLPAGFQGVLEATFGQRNEVRWIDEQLWAFVGGHPTFMLEVETPQRLRVADQPAAINFEIVGGVPANATLELMILGEQFQLPLATSPLT
jgi:hypothetical protein